MRICYGAAQHACKGILPRFLAHAHNREDTERLFSLERAFRAICAYCKRFCDDPVLPRSHQRTLCARALLRTFRCAHPLRSSRICFAKMRRTFLSPRLKKRDRPSYFAKNDVPMSFSTARRFVGTAFCRYGVLSVPEDKTPFSRILSRDPDSDPCAPSQTAVFAAISGFAARIVSSPVCGRISKNTRLFRALNTFREVIAVTATHIRRPFFPPLRLLTQGFKARPQLYARALFRLVRRPANRRRPFDFRSEQAMQTSRTYVAPRFLPQHSLKNAFLWHFCRKFLFAKSSCVHAFPHAPTHYAHARPSAKSPSSRDLARNFLSTAARVCVCALCARVLCDPDPTAAKVFYRFFVCFLARICESVRAHVCNIFIIIYV